MNKRAGYYHIYHPLQENLAAHMENKNKLDTRKITLYIFNFKAFVKKALKNSQPRKK